MIINLSRLKSCKLVKCQELISRYYFCELKVRKFQKEIAVSPILLKIKLFLFIISALALASKVIKIKDTLLDFK